MGIGVSGLMSGLDTDSIIKKLMDIERRPIDLLRQKEEQYQAKITALGKVKSAMSELRSSVEAMTDAKGFYSYEVSSSDETILTVSANDDLQPGSYSITVSQLAAAQQLRSSAFSASDSEIGTGTISIQVGDSDAVEIEITSENNTLSGIARSINRSRAKVTAGVINDGNGNYYLTLQSQETGEDNTISLTIQDDDGNNSDSSGLSAIYTDSSAQTLTETQAAANAILTVNGISVERSSNEIGDLIQGISIDLKQASPEKTVTISPVKGNDGLVNKVKDFVEKYNSFIDQLHKLTSYNAATEQGAVLLGDGTIGRIDLRLSRLIHESIGGVQESVNSLSKLGVTIEESGKLSFDQARLEKAMTDSPDDVVAFFTSKEEDNQGFARKLEHFLDGYLKFGSGILAVKVDGLQKSSDKINDRIESLEFRISKREENLRHQFNILENLLAQFQQTSGQLEQQLSAIKNLNNQISK